MSTKSELSIEFNSVYIYIIILFDFTHISNDMRMINVMMSEQTYENLQSKLQLARYLHLIQMCRQDEL